jgi:hypothetical protein
MSERKPSFKGNFQESARGIAANYHESQAHFLFDGR